MAHHLVSKLTVSNLDSQYFRSVGLLTASIVALTPVRPALVSRRHSVKLTRGDAASLPIAASVRNGRRVPAVGS